MNERRRGPRGPRARVRAHHHQRVPRGAGRRRVPAAGRPRRRAAPWCRRRGEVRTYGVVTEAEAVYEGASFESDTHRVAELGILPAAKVRSAQVAVTRVDPEVWVSPDPGEVVERATGEARRKALYVDEMGRPLRGRASGATASPSTSTSTSSTAARAATCRSAASAVWPRRPRSRCSSCGCSRRASTRRWSARARRRCACWSSTSRARTCCGSTRPNRLFDEDARTAWATLGVEPSPFPSVRFWAPPAPALGRRPAPRHRRPPRGRGRLRVDAARVHRRGPAAVLLHRRERLEEPAPVHPRARAGPAAAVRRGRGGPARRRRAARPALHAARAAARPCIPTPASAS